MAFRTDERVFFGCTEEGAMIRDILVTINEDEGFAAEASAENLMGAYGRSRLHQMVLGGVTRETLRSMTVPTLMSH
jgi:hypothetical protein